MMNPTILNYLQNGKFENLSIDDFKHKVICLTLAYWFGLKQTIK